MSEQELIDKKIEEREKTDIMISYVMIVILVVCIAFVAYLKLTSKEESNIINDNTTDDNVVDNVPANLTLSELASIAGDRLNTKYNGIIISQSDDGLSITYGDINYELPLLNNELEFTIDSDNKELSEDIYRELIASVCAHYTNDRDNCNNASKALNSSNSVTGARFVGENKVYIDTVNYVNPTDIISGNDYTDNASSDSEIQNGDVAASAGDVIELE